MAATGHHMAPHFGGDIASELSRISSKVSISITNSGVIVLTNTRQRKSNAKSRMDNPETLATLGTHCTGQRQTQK